MTWALVIAAITVGTLHALAPDHWVPIAAVGRARGWSVGRTARVAVACGFGHVTVSVLLGLVGLVTGRGAVEAFGEGTASISAVLLIGFGLGYVVWGLRRRGHAHLHGHADVHVHDHDHDHDHDQRSRRSVWALIAIYAADPCVAVIPILFAAATLPAAATVGVVVAYEVATIAAMVALVAAARLGAARVRDRWIERWGDSAAGASIVLTGVAVAVLGW